MRYVHSIKNLEIKHLKLKKGYYCNQAIHSTPEKTVKEFNQATCKNCVGIVERSEVLRKKFGVKERLLIETSCPLGHKNVDYVNFGHRDYCFCFTCKKKYYRYDYDKQ